VKALLSHAAGGPETLAVEYRPDPVPGPGEVLVKVRACSVNYPDALILRDMYQFKPQRPFDPRQRNCRDRRIGGRQGNGLEPRRPG